MTLGLDRSKVLLVDYNPDWPKFYYCEVEALKKLLGSEAISFDHVGSTAIPGLKAKPVIDILVQIPTTFISSESEKILLSNNYKKTVFERRIEPMYSKTLEGNVASHNIHITQVGSILAKALTNFRDALRSDDLLAKKYEDLKLDLAGRFSGNRKAYYDAKINFFESVVGKYFEPVIK